MKVVQAFEVFMSQMAVFHSFVVFCCCFCCCCFFERGGGDISLMHNSLV